MDYAETTAEQLALEYRPAQNDAVRKRGRPPGKPTQRSAVTNGSRPFILGDGNSPWFRRYKDIAEMHSDDLGGAANLSQAQLSLCRRAATMEVELERQEGLLSLGQEIDLEVYSRIAGNLRRVHETLGAPGLERRKRPVPAAMPDLTPSELKASLRRAASDG